MVCAGVRREPGDPAGDASVDVMEIEGATAIVYPRELLP